MKKISGQWATQGLAVPSEIFYDHGEEVEGVRLEVQNLSLIDT